MSQARILFLEDSRQFAEVFVETFKQVADIRHVSTFKSFQQAIVRDGKFDLVVSDVNVPMFDGGSPQNRAFESLAEVRRYLKQDVPFVFITSDPNAEGLSQLDVAVFDKISTAEWKQHITSYLN